MGRIFGSVPWVFFTEPLCCTPRSCLDESSINRDFTGSHLLSVRPSRLYDCLCGTVARFIQARSRATTSKLWTCKPLNNIALQHNNKNIRKTIQQLTPSRQLPPTAKTFPHHSSTHCKTVFSRLMISKRYFLITLLNKRSQPKCSDKFAGRRSVAYLSQLAADTMLMTLKVAITL